MLSERCIDYIAIDTRTKLHMTSGMQLHYFPTLRITHQSARSTSRRTTTAATHAADAPRRNPSVCTSAHRIGNLDHAQQRRTRRTN